MGTIDQLIANNRKWLNQIRQDNPHFFSQFHLPQKPKYLWIGCTDSRIPGIELLGMSPGEVFIHRNVGNLVNSDDSNCNTVIKFAIEGLGIREILIVGHSLCGAIEAVETNSQSEIIGNWIAPIKKTREQNALELDAIANPHDRLQKLAELNVVAQVKNITNHHLTQYHKQKIKVYGLMYNLTNGKLDLLES